MSLKTAYKEIYQGFSSAVMGDQLIFFKHLSPIDYAEIEEAQERAKIDAKKIGLISVEEKEKICLANGSWNLEKQKSIDDLSKEIEILNNSKRKLLYEGQMEEIQSIVDEYHQQLDVLKQEKSKIFGKTIESYANDVSNRFYIYCSAYKDGKMDERYLSEEEFEYLNFETFYRLTYLYDSCFQKFEIKNIKLLALESYIMRSFSICGEGKGFFPKPVPELTFNQICLLAQLRDFKLMLEECHDAPNEVLMNPTKLEEAFYIKRNKENKKESSDGGASKLHSLARSIKRSKSKEVSIPNLPKVL